MDKGGRATGIVWVEFLKERDAFILRGYPRQILIEENPVDADGLNFQAKRERASEGGRQLLVELCDFRNPWICWFVFSF